MRGPNGDLVEAQGSPLNEVMPDVAVEVIDYLKLEKKKTKKPTVTKEQVLQADVQQGGALLAGRLKSVTPVCNDKLGNPLGVDSCFYMWEGLNTTLHRVVGLQNSLDMA